MNSEVVIDVMFVWCLYVSCWMFLVIMGLGVVVSCSCIVCCSSAVVFLEESAWVMFF